MAEHRYSVVVFDWDGTLFDSAPGIASSIQEASREMGLRVPDRATASHVIGLGLEDSLRHAVPDLPAPRYRDFVEIYRRHFLELEAEMRFFSGVPELLGELTAGGRTLAVATGKSRVGLERALDASGLRSHFTATRCGDETRPKPHPAMLIELIAELGADPHRVLMVGDTSHDLKMAHSAGVDSVAVAYGAHPVSVLRDHQPRACVASIEELREWLSRHG